MSVTWIAHHLWVVFGFHQNAEPVFEVNDVQNLVCNDQAVAGAESIRNPSGKVQALFHKNLQISPGEYIRRIKLQESKQMIRENNLNFTEIAAQLHYSTVHHFSRQFKEKFGITPTEYAKSVR